MPKYITTNKVLIDWITVTTYRQDVFSRWQTIVGELEGVLETGIRRLQYKGFQMETDGGSVFCGVGLQHGNSHYMLQASGEIAQEVSRFIYTAVDSEQATITRIDFQVTIESEDFSLWRAFNRLKMARENVGWHESKITAGLLKGKLTETLYVGSRKSDRFARIYTKFTAGGSRLLRLEVEVKGRAAKSLGRILARYPIRRLELARAELLKQAERDAKVRALFEPYIMTNEQPVKVIDDREGNTYDWIMHTCLPAIDRYVNAHRLDGHVTIVKVMQEILDGYQYTG